MSLKKRAAALAAATAVSSVLTIGVVGTALADADELGGVATGGGTADGDNPSGGVLTAIAVLGLAGGAAAAAATPRLPWSR